ncbi:Metallo-dependent phosphatase-like protein [Sphaerosporella brunnea]|uniref:Metallo-dependent phosphatase-like protein n=1 Tax=Sphaerosporella brunnea TaxID=1250544 RepID=A0A5J5ENB4_9PEZI|nr:Metallo-dependent phosphatase-like protein [Sphaerosporella brunnea]
MEPPANLIYHRVYAEPPPRSELAPSQLTDDGLPVLPAAIQRRTLTTSLDGPSSPLTPIPPSLPLPPAAPRRKKLRLVCISDTHQHTPYLPRGDILLHAGDLSNDGSVRSLGNALSWLSSQPHPHKLFIAGNHDLAFDGSFVSAETHQECLSLLAGKALTYLTPEKGIVEVCGLKFFGSPYSPRSTDRAWAFQYERGGGGEQPWSAVPEGVDVLLTHSPPKFHLDRSGSVLPPEMHSGSETLRRRVAEVRPLVHVFGHVHAGRGVERVRWAPPSRVDWREEGCVSIEDPSPESAKRQFLVDATQLERGRETLCVNASIAKGPWRKGEGRVGGWGKPVVVDIMVDGVEGE